MEAKLIFVDNCPETLLGIIEKEINKKTNFHESEISLLGGWTTKYDFSRERDSITYDKTNIEFDQYNCIDNKNTQTFFFLNQISQ